MWGAGRHAQLLRELFVMLEQQQAEGDPDAARLRDALLEHGQELMRQDPALGLGHSSSSEDSDDDDDDDEEEEEEEEGY